MTLFDILPGKGKHAATQGKEIVVNLHGLVVKENKLVQREPFLCRQEQIIAEELENKVIQEVGIANFAVPLFGLCRVQQNHHDWLLPSSVIKSGDVLHFSLRLPFADQARLASVAKHCPVTMDYIYGQFRERFLNKQLDLGDISRADYASIITRDLRCHGYMLRLKVSELKTFSYDKFAGHCYNGLIDKITLRDYCMDVRNHSSDHYKIRDGGELTDEAVAKEINNCKYQYVADILKHVTQGGIFKCRDGSSLSVESRVQSEGAQGLWKTPKDQTKACPLMAVNDICSVDVRGTEVDIMSFDTRDTLKRETFSMCREEDATSVGLLLNVLYKLSVNYFADVWQKAQSQKAQIYQENCCYPPSRDKWVKERLYAVSITDATVRYIITEDLMTCGILKVAYLDKKKSLADLILSQTNSDDKKWNIQGHAVPVHLDDLRNHLAELLETTSSDISAVPLLLPYNDTLYHCRESEQTVHHPLVLNKYTITSYICDKTTTSVHAAKANFKTTAKSKAEDIVIKKLEKPELFKVFTDMICQMTHWRHENLICLHGVSFATGVDALLDYFARGNLRDFINYELQGSLKVLHLVKITEQLFRALVYLQEKITLVEKEPGELSSYHGNIKMSKLMVSIYSENDIVIKLGDPGLYSVAGPASSENLAVLKRLPWRAPEIMDGKSTFTSFSDMYAFGITLWEIWSVGLLPFREINNKTHIADSDKVKLIVQYVKGGGHLNKPRWAPLELYDLMKDCWKGQPTARPSPQTLQRKFHALLPSVSLQQKCDQLRDQEDWTFEEGKIDWDSVQELPDEVQQNIANSQEAAAAAAAGQAPSVHSVITSQQEPKSNIPKLAKQICSINVMTFDKKILGRGAFGNVTEGLLHYSDERKRKVAVKACLKENDENSEALRNEIHIMCELEHENVVKLEGYYLDKGAWYLVMEFMEGGALRAFLKNKEAPIATLARIAQDTAKGMAYLFFKKVIHKDLAARNVLLTGIRGPRLTAKISDFGLSKILQTGNYVYKLTQPKCPWKWYPPEALEKGIFTTDSDVWSYGCVVWEIFDKCQNDLALADGKHAQIEHRNKLQKGDRKAKPELCPPEIYNEVILKCWERDHKRRPKFTEIIDIWNNLILQHQNQW